MDVYENEESNEKETALVVGQVLVLTLPENPTTGYTWQFVTEGSPACVLIDDSFRAGEPQLGAPGIHRWRFRGETPGEGRIEMRLVRKWNPTVPIRSFALTAKVSEPRA
jgi:inhibitor of cysteine peptidase